MAASWRTTAADFGLREERSHFPFFSVDAVRAKHAKGIAVVSANNRFDLLRSHESLIVKYGRFSGVNAESRAALASGRFD